jgi:hypothetical protein
MSMSDWLMSVDFVDSKNGWAVGRWGVILHTLDGGVTWQQQVSGSGNPLTCVEFVSRDSGWVCGSPATMIETTDGGLAWEPQIVPYNLEITSLQFLNSSEGWGSTDDGLLIHTSNGGVTFIAPEPTGVIPHHFALYQNYPNPFNPTTTIRYLLPSRVHVTLSVFNTLGQQIATLLNETEDAGYHDVRFDGSGLASGVYFYRLHARDFVQTKKVVILR